MSTSLGADHIDTVRRFYAAGPAEDDSHQLAYAAPDIVWHVPGANPVSGRYAGLAEVFEAIPARMGPLDEWRIEVRDVMANGALVVATVEVTAARGGHRMRSGGAHVFRFDAVGRIAEAWGFVADQQALDAVLRAEPAAGTPRCSAP